MNYVKFRLTKWNLFQTRKRFETAPRNQKIINLPRKSESSSVLSETKCLCSKLFSSEFNGKQLFTWKLAWLVQLLFSFHMCFFIKFLLKCTQIITSPQHQKIFFSLLILLLFNTRIFTWSIHITLQATTKNSSHKLCTDIYTNKFFSHDNVVFTREKSRDFMANLMHKNNSFTWNDERDSPDGFW